MLRAIARTIKEFWGHPKERRLLYAAGALLLGGTIFYRLAEGWSWVDSLYFTIVTLTTVGFGDLHPTSPASKLFTIVFVLAGVGFFLAFLNYLMTRTAQRRSREIDEQERSG